MNNLEFPAWDFNIGDPSIMGWLTVAAYFLSAGLAYLVFRQSAQTSFHANLKKQQLFWIMTASALFLLGINKQLDLQSYLTAIGKYYAKRDGWYATRFVYQSLFIKAIIASTITILLFLLWYLKETLRENGLAVFGLCLLAAFIAIRAASFHHVDIFINSTILNVRVNWIMELSGIIMITLCAGKLLRSSF